VTKIQSQAGVSLADTYDVVGSVAGIEQLESREVTLAHEMGGTIFSERFSQVIRRVQSGFIGQSLPWDVVVGGFSRTVTRIIGVAVQVNVTTRVALATVLVQDSRSGRETPIWIWDSAVDGEVGARFSDDGAAAGTVIFLRPTQPVGAIPLLVSGSEQPEHTDVISFRGLTTAFGAGTVQATVFVHTAFAEVSGISSRGLPIPSW